MNYMQFLDIIYVLQSLTDLLSLYIFVWFLRIRNLCRFLLIPEINAILKLYIYFRYILFVYLYLLFILVFLSKRESGDASPSAPLSQK